MGRVRIRPSTPFFSPSSRGRPSFGVDKPINCSGYVGLAAGLPGTYSILVRVLPGLRVIPKNCSGYCTRALVTRQPGIFYLEILLPGKKTSNCSGYAQAQVLVFGVGLSGHRDRGSGIGIYVYIPLFIYILSIIFFFFFRFFWQK